MKQDIKKAEAELNKVKVEVDTRIKSADYQKAVTLVININLEYSRRRGSSNITAKLGQYRFIF